MILQEFVTTVFCYPSASTNQPFRPETWFSRKRPTMGEETSASSSEFKGKHLDFVCTTTFLDFSTGKIPPKNGSVSKNLCLSQIPPKPPTPRNVFSLDDSIKGSLSRLHWGATQQTLTRLFFWGEPKKPFNALNPKCCNATTNFCYQKQTGLEPFSQKS